MTTESPKAAASRRIRYAVVGLGYISQDAVLPAFPNAPNSQLAALVTGDPRKAQEVGAHYGVTRTCSYEQYDELLKSGDIDAVFIALPNTMHCDFSVRAARAGIHVLCEKPLAETEAECRQMIAAAEQNGIKLMTAYRLHFEPSNLWAVDVVRKGRIGDPRIFHSVFTMQAAAGNSRLNKALCGGSLLDMGVYCINAARYMFGDEPTEVSAWSLKSGDPRFESVLETVSAMLRFPGERVATFTTSYGAARVNMLEVVGTQGILRLEPVFNFHLDVKATLQAGGKTRRRTFKKQDQFGAQLLYFSNCILNNVEPEPDGPEGLADVQIIEAILASAETGRVVPLNLPPRARRPGIAQEIRLPFLEPPPKVNVMLPGS